MKLAVGNRIWWLAFGIGAVCMMLLLNGLRNEAPSSSGQEQQQTQLPSAETPLKKLAPQQEGTVAAEQSQEQLVQARSELERLRIAVELTQEKRTEKVPLELYVRGVLAGEMPASFELEALKAQAITARTYIIRQLHNGERQVTDTVVDQVYIPLNGITKLWPEEQADSNLAKLSQAVDETKGLILTYEGKPIEAAFFSTSNGYTENSNDYWAYSQPYLRSVASPWDAKLSPRYEQQLTMKLTDFYKKLDVKKGAEKSMRVLEYTSGRRIKEILIGGQRFTGRELRERLSLASSHIAWQVKGKEIIFTTLGYGHGVGMSQWGANGMALEGRSAVEILKHYYSGVEVERLAELPDGLEL